MVNFLFICELNLIRKTVSEPFKKINGLVWQVKKKCFPFLGFRTPLAQAMPFLLHGQWNSPCTGSYKPGSFPFLFLFFQLLLKAQCVKRVSSGRKSANNLTRHNGISKTYRCPLCVGHWLAGAGVLVLLSRESYSAWYIWCNLNYIHYFDKILPKRREKQLN